MSRRLTQSELAERARLELEPCPPSPRGCGARPGEHCVNVATGDGLGRQLVHVHRRYPTPLSQRSAPPVSEPSRPLDIRELAAAS